MIRFPVFWFGGASHWDFLGFSMFDVYENANNAVAESFAYARRHERHVTPCSPYWWCPSQQVSNVKTHPLCEACRIHVTMVTNTAQNSKPKNKLTILTWLLHLPYIRLKSCEILGVNPSTMLLQGSGISLCTLIKESGQLTVKIIIMRYIFQIHFKQFGLW